jgi:lactate 2-monooxygenase
MTEDNKGEGDAPYASYLRGIVEKGLMEGHLPVVSTNPNKLEVQAQKIMDRKGFEYVCGGAGESATVDANRAAFRHWQIVPNILKPTSPRDLSVTLFGKKYGTCTQWLTLAAILTYL